MAQYTIRLHPTAKTNLHDLSDSDRERITTVLEEVAGTRKPTDHSKCELLESQKGAKAYKVRVGDYRVVAELSKPYFNVLQLGHRSKVYQGVDDVYAAL